MVEDICSRSQEKDRQSAIEKEKQKSNRRLLEHQTAHSLHYYHILCVKRKMNEKAILKLSGSVCIEEEQLAQSQCTHRIKTS